VRSSTPYSVIIGETYVIDTTAWRVDSSGIDKLNGVHVVVDSISPSPNRSEILPHVAVHLAEGFEDYWYSQTFTINSKGLTLARVPTIEDLEAATEGLLRVAKELAHGS